MISEIPERAKKRNKPRCICISDNTINEILNFTKGHMSISCFVRLAVAKEIERLKKDG